MEAQLLIVGTKMASADAAAWAQAYLSAAAILVSGAVAIAVPWNERRLAKKRENDARLSIECVRSEIGGLQLTISYTPEFRSHALGVNVEILEPADAQAFQGVRRVNRESWQTEYEAGVVRGMKKKTRYEAVSLLRREDSDAHEGVIFIEDPEAETIHRAKIKVSILRHGNHIVSSTKMVVSPSDAIYYENGAPTALIKDQS